MAPKQKPSTSKQDYSTPNDFLVAVRRILAIEDFAIDLAADASNTVCKKFIDEKTDSLKDDVSWKSEGWAFLNPPYKNIAPWAEKAWLQSKVDGAKVALLVPASVGANWWRCFVHKKALVLFLNGRLSFLENGDPYPKDLALLLYGFTPIPEMLTDYLIWDWRRGEIY